MRPLKPSRLPETPGKAALVSGEYPQLAAALERLGIQPIPTQRDSRLPEPVAWHPDMQACVIGGKVITLREGPLVHPLEELGLELEQTVRSPEERYPQDAICNVLAWDKFVMGNPHTADIAVVRAVQSLGLTWISVKQGYAACSAALVTSNAAITADEGVAAQLEQYQITVLRISPGHIRLPGYDTGFIGGCCGKLAPNQLAFAGSLDSHPDGKRIREFLASYNVSFVELLKGELTDVGGIIPLC